MRKDFVRCGITGCCIEFFWTTLNGVKNKDYKLIGQTSMWMFPIYGMAAVIKPISNKLKKNNKDIISRGLIYTMGIYVMEYATGAMLKKKDRCPWDYSKSKYNVNGLIRLDYAPLWFAMGLLYEKLLTNENGTKINESATKK